MSVGYCYELYPDEVPRSFKWDAWDPSLERNSWGFLGIPKKKGSESSSNPAQCWFGSQQCVRGRTDAHQENDERSWSRKRETMECPYLPNLGEDQKMHQRRSSGHGSTFKTQGARLSRHF